MTITSRMDGKWAGTRWFPGWEPCVIGSEIMTNENTQAIQGTVETVMSKTLATLELHAAQRTMQQPQSERPKKDSSRWADKWLAMKETHPDIAVLKQVVIAFCSGYARAPRVGRRLVVYGENGSGKSHVARAIHKWANRAAILLPPVSRYDTYGLAVSEYRSWPKVVDGFKNDQWDLNDLFEANMLVLDDVGAEHDPSKFGVNKLYQLLEDRLNRWTVITTNIVPEAWEEKFERRICDRLFRNCTHVDLTRVPSFSVNTL